MLWPTELMPLYFCAVKITKPARISFKMITFVTQQTIHGTDKNHRDMNTKPVTYIAAEGLRAAVDVARALGMPLLVTGEPGTGKTQLAYWVAQLIREEEAKTKGTKPLDEKQDPRVLRFNTKTTSVARDLFYRFDAVRHFRATHQKPDEPANVFDYLSFEALGKAILAAGQRQFVVLVDEIDKAPRDFPNDVLFEFEELAFRVEEATAADFEGYKGRFGKKPEFAELKVEVQDPGHKLGVISLQENAPKPVLILTSNSEKNLPDAFLRRCIFYHIPFPGKEDLIEIVKKNARISGNYKKLIAKAVKDFENIRQTGMRKLPSTAELIHWVEILAGRGIDLEKAGKDPKVYSALKNTLPVLAKNKDDLEKLNTTLESKLRSGQEKQQ